jgi:sulfite reductase beta subunit-like hemoprotein
MISHVEISEEVTALEALELAELENKTVEELQGIAKELGMKTEAPESRTSSSRSCRRTLSRVA